MAVQTTRQPAIESPAVPKLQRKDNWLLGPLSFFLLFTTFSVYVTFRAFQNNFYLADHYLSPLYSPTIQTGWKILGYHISPALYILVFPLAFRMSCYYYRKMIYRSYIADPAGCAVMEPAPLEKARFKKYRGERAFPLIVMNFHRFAFYAAVVFIVILWKDAIDAFFFTSPDGSVHPGVHIGTLVFLINIVLLSAYTFSCHSWRHLIGGGTDCYSCSALSKTRYGLWKQVSFLNEAHGRWAMMSLVTVALTDLYVMLVASRTIVDIKIF